MENFLHRTVQTTVQNHGNAKRTVVREQEKQALGSLFLIAPLPIASPLGERSVPHNKEAISTAMPLLQLE